MAINISIRLQGREIISLVEEKKFIPEYNDNWNFGFLTRDVHMWKEEDTLRGWFFDVEDEMPIYFGTPIEGFLEKVSE